MSVQRTRHELVGKLVRCVLSTDTAADELRYQLRALLGV